MASLTTNLDKPILVVDDYRAMVSIIRRMLFLFGFTNVVDATDGASALEKLRAGCYSLVISDLMMEPMDGLTLLSRIRSDADLRSTPFVMVTASSEEAKILAAREAGVTAYILKPFTAEILKKRLSAVLGRF